MFVNEIDLYAATAYIYQLYTLYRTQIGMNPNSEEEDPSYTVVCIPIDLSRSDVGVLRRLHEHTHQHDPGTVLDRSPSSRRSDRPQRVAREEGVLDLRLHSQL